MRPVVWKAPGEFQRWDLPLSLAEEAYRLIDGVMAGE